ncbi:MAG: phosphate ABC transporter permease subunit PstC [Ghiorsea sp.]
MFDFILNSAVALLLLAAIVGIAVYQHVVKSRSTTSWHSLPLYYAWFAALWCFGPAFTLFFFASVLELFHLYTANTSFLLPATLFLSIAGLWHGVRQIKPSLRARQTVEAAVRFSLIASAGVSILTTIGIVFAIIFEAIQFFDIVSLGEFLTGTHWAPDDATDGNTSGMFGSIPIFAGTFMITIIAMLVAVPVGILSAVYMSEYASERVRNTAKPALEILAGIPTVVYGFFAAITVSPLVVQFADSVGLHADFTNALTPGIVMGIMIIPFISSLSDDVIRAVPRSLRDASLALGTTTSETIIQIVLPAALPGIIAACLLGISRALGETMIVVMAAGLRPNLTWNPLEGMTTVTVRIVDALTGDQAFDSPETLSAFGLGMVLLVITLLLNIVSIYVTRRFRSQYE